MCKHEGFYTCIGRYDRGTGRLVYFMVCDDCHQTLRPVMEQPYEPHFVERAKFGGAIAESAAPQPA